MLSYFVDDRDQALRKCRSFHQALEGFCGRPGTDGRLRYMHNRVHNMVRGSTCCSATSPNDPLFLLHHTQIDRIFNVSVLLLPFFQQFRLEKNKQLK